MLVQQPPGRAGQGESPARGGAAGRTAVPRALGLCSHLGVLRAAQHPQSSWGAQDPPAQTVTPLCLQGQGRASSEASDPCGVYPARLAASPTLGQDKGCAVARLAPCPSCPVPSSSSLCQESPSPGRSPGQLGSAPQSCCRPRAGRAAQQSWQGRARAALPLLQRGL